MGFVVDNKTSFADLWSAPVPEVLVDTTGVDQALPDILIANRPNGVQRAIMMFKYRAVEDDSAAPNNIAGAQVMQASLDAFVTPVDAIHLVDLDIPVAASVKEGGDVIMGDVDIKAALPQDGALMNFRWALATSVGDSLHFRDVQVGIRFYYI